ncbi:MAG TPA: hypothetical protein VKB50_01785 [Vicinamibacterales bacterium]|nr:hypothetical protein [Vicinamibacterales bacterium]
MRITQCVLIAMCLPVSSLIAQAPSSESFQPVATMKQLMLEIIHPASNEIQLAASRTPSTDQEWAALRRNAMTLAESGNLLIMRNRAIDWVSESRSLIEVGAVAYKAAEGHDAKAIAALSGRLDASCTNCHTKFRPALFDPDSRR